MYKLTQDVMMLNTGFSRPAGRQIGKAEVRNDALWDMWVAEGIVIEVDKAPPAPQEPEKEEAPLPHAEPLMNKEEGDKQLRDLSDEELRGMARKHKIRSWHLMKRETLIESIEELS